MKFYSLSYEATMALPMKAFWHLNDNVNRLRAESEMRLLSVMAVAQQGGEVINDTMKRLSAEIGLVMLAKPIRDEAGLSDLKLMI